MCLSSGFNPARTLSLTPRLHEHSEHNEDQKTTVTLLNREMGDMISVDGISQVSYISDYGRKQMYISELIQIGRSST